MSKKFDWCAVSYRSALRYFFSDHISPLQPWRRAAPGWVHSSLNDPYCESVIIMLMTGMNAERPGTCKGHCSAPTFLVDFLWFCALVEPRRNIVFSKKERGLLLKNRKSCHKIKVCVVWRSDLFHSYLFSVWFPCCNIVFIFPHVYENVSSFIHVQIG